MNRYDTFKKLLFAVFIINILLVSTHEGEFWPFSIFPMFSQAGNPWTRAMVVDVQRDGQDIWATQPLDSVAARAVSLNEYDVDQIDYANFVSKTEIWTDRRIRALRRLFDIDRRPGEQWMITKVHGHLTETDSVVVEAVPLMLITSDSTYKNPDLF